MRRFRRVLPNHIAGMRTVGTITCRIGLTALHEGANHEDHPTPERQVLEQEEPQELRMVHLVLTEHIFV
jgi:hypothetical protein